MTNENDWVSVEDDSQDWVSENKDNTSIADSLINAGSSTLHALDRLGPAQLRNLSALAFGQKENNLKNNVEMLTGENAPSYEDILNKLGVKDINFNLDSNAENIKDFKTTPSISEEEKNKLIQTEATIPTSQLGGAALDFYLGGKAGEASIGLIPKSVNALSRGVTSGFNKGIESLSNSTYLPKTKQNVDDIIKAAKELGIEVTPGMLDDSVFLERLESSLANSPSIFGQRIKRNLTNAYEKMRGATGQALESASTSSPFELGEEFKSGITANIGERLDPLSATFQDVAESTKNIPLSERSLAAIQRNASNIDMVQMGIGAEKANQYINAIPKLKNADQVKTLMTLLNSDIQAASGAEKNVLLSIKDKLKRLEENSIMRSAIQAAKESGGAIRQSTGQNIGKEIITDLQAARKGYRDLSQDITSVSKDAGLKSTNPTGFLNELENIPSENVMGKFANLKNNRQLVNLQEKFPEQFELLRQGRIGEIASKSVDNSLMGKGELSTKKFLDEVRKLNPEAKKMLFGDKSNLIENLDIVQKNFPRNFNPSGTAGELGYKDILGSNIKDIGNYAMYQASSSNLAKKVSQALQKNPKLQALQVKNPEAFNKFVSKMTQSFNAIPDEQPKLKTDKNHIIEKTKGSKYSQVLQNAANNGDKSFNAANYVLQQTQPEYRQLLEDEEQ